MKTPFPALHIVTAVLIAALSLVILKTLEKGDNPQLLNQANESNRKHLKPSKQYAFYDYLKANEVVITQSNYLSTPKESNLKHPTLLQIAAVRTKGSATSIARKLKAAGLTTVQVIERNTNNGMLYLVRTKPYSTYSSIKSGISLAEKHNFHPNQIQVK